MSLLLLKTELLKCVFWASCAHFLTFSPKPTLFRLLPFPIPSSTTAALVKYTSDLYVGKSSDQFLLFLFFDRAAAFDPVDFVSLSLSLSLSLSQFTSHCCFLDFLAFSLFCPLYLFSGWSQKGEREGGIRTKVWGWWSSSAASQMLRKRNLTMVVGSFL